MTKKRMEGRNTVEVLHQCNQRGYRCYYKNYEENNILCDIVPFVLIMDTTWHKYNMSLLEAVGMTPTRNTFIVATAFIQNEKAKTYQWFFHFGSETTNRAKSGHSLLQAWIVTRHGDLDTVFLKIDSLIEGQITEIKTTIGYARLKEKDNDKSNPVIAQLCYNVSHLALRIIKDEIKRAPKILVDPEDLCRHWVRTSHMPPCSC
ncbi:hypothetical protein M9H77_08881 [Catharanthus roseus]|uniref:Uncharacterized protein n=1 Tax=Catharanthus roseus TaxID=4058 RepID=A0ACC0BZ78_CATRO|nr:hypothetical protein M9H77_08881 [Catharanthus roseus]